MTNPAGGATSAPGATSSFAPPDANAGTASCHNCGAPITSRFCADCGQRATAPDPTLREMLEEVAAEVLHWDGKLWVTLTTLVRRPGELTLDYISGRRVRYISPLRLYLAASVLFFFLSAVGPQSPERQIVRFSPSDSAGTAATTGNTDGIVVGMSARELDSTGGGDLGARVQRRLEQGVERTAKSPDRFVERIRDHVATVVFLVLPAFAFAVGLAYRRQKRHFPQHVVFALHVHAVVFLGFTLSELSRFTRHERIETTVNLVVAMSLLAYVVASLRKVYGGTIGRTIAKALALGLVYLCFFGAGMIALTIFGFLTT